MLGEFGDDPERYESAKSRRNYAGTSPLTVASGRKRTVRARFVRNRRLSDAADRWALCARVLGEFGDDPERYESAKSRRNYAGHCRRARAATTSTMRRRAAGDLHHQALRALGNRLVGYLHGCLRTRTCYDEATAWAHRHDREQLAA